MTPEPAFKIFWIAWIVAFGVVEFIAVKRVGQGDTLSEFIWWLIGTNSEDRDMWRWAARALILGTLLWLIPHFMTGWKWFK